MTGKSRTLAVVIIRAIALLLTIGVSTPSPTRASDLPTVDEILTRYIEAVGGREALEKLKVRDVSGYLIDDRPLQGPITIPPFDARAVAPDSYEYSEHRKEGPWREGFDGNRAWEEKNGVRRPRPGAWRGRSKLAWLLNPQGPLQVRDYFPGLRVRGLETLGGREVYALEPARDNAYFTLYFDRGSGLLTQIGHYWQLEFYEEMDGVMLPRQIVTGRKGGSNIWVFETIGHDLP